MQFIYIIYILKFYKKIMKNIFVENNESIIKSKQKKKTIIFSKSIGVKIRNSIKIQLYKFILFFTFIYPKIYTIRNKIYYYKSYTYDITIKIKGNNLYSIFNAHECPNEIYLNNGTLIGTKTCNLEIGNDIKILILKWTNPIDGFTLFHQSNNNILEVDLSDTTITSLVGMFHGCTSLTSINLSNLNTSLVSDMFQAFYDCKSLKSIDLSKLDLTNVRTFHNLFYGCENLEYINFINYNELQDQDNSEYLGIDKGVPANLVICIKEELAPKLFSFLKNRKCTVIYCGENWRKMQKKLIEKENNTCVDICEETVDYLYEYEGKCYKENPIKSTIVKQNNIEITEIELNDNKKEPLLNKFIYEVNNITEKKLMVENLINEIKGGLFKGYLLESNKTDIIKEIDSEIYQISTLIGQLNSVNISSINLGACEDLLKSANNINPNEDLVIFKIAHLSPELKTQILEYRIFSIEGEELSLDSCGDSRIQYGIPVEINESELYKYDPNSKYYNDICFQSTSDKGTDITQYDRKKEYNEKNMAFCENNCEFVEYNKKSKKVLCDCKIKNSFNNLYDIDKKDLLKKFSNYKNIFNVEIIKCYKIIFSIDKLIKNIGNYIILSIISIHIFCSILFIIKEYNKFMNTIKNESKNNLYLISSHKKTKKLRNNKKVEKHKSNPIKRNNKIKSGRKTQTSKSRVTKDSLKSGKDKNKNKINDYEMNSLIYEESISYDNRTFCQYYLSLIRQKQLLIFTFYTSNDYNSKIIKICSFFISFSIYYAIKALFFNDSVMHTIYINNGVYDFINQLPQIIYSTIISGIIRIILSFLSSTQANVVQIKNLNKKKNNYKRKYKQKMNIIKIKFILFFIINFLLLILFWFYLSCFCAVYKNTQIYLIKDTLISFGLSMVYPFFICLFPCIFRIYSLSSRKNKRKYCYSFSKLLQLI